MKGWIWALICLTAGIGLGVMFQQDIVLTGTDIKLSGSTNFNLNIQASSEVTFEAASSQFFLLYKENGESFIAQPAKPPLGWSSDSYYTSGPSPISTGNWIVEKGSPKIELTSAKPITVTESAASPEGFWFAALALAVVVWLGGIILFST